MQGVVSVGWGSPARCGPGVSLQKVFTIARWKSLGRLNAPRPRPATCAFLCPPSACRLERDLGIRLSLDPATNKYFPTTNSAKTVRDALLGACLRAGVRVRYRSPCGAPVPAGGGGWALGLAAGAATAPRPAALVMAAGGASFPALGTTGDGYGALGALGHAVRAPFPALTPLTGRHPGGARLAGLAVHGAALEARRPGSRRALQVSPRGDVLLTHRGYSGPAVLDLSHHAVRAGMVGVGEEALPKGKAPRQAPGAGEEGGLAGRRVMCVVRKRPQEHRLPRE